MQKQLEISRKLNEDVSLEKFDYELEKKSQITRG